MRCLPNEISYNSMLKAAEAAGHWQLVMSPGTSFPTPKALLWIQRSGTHVCTSFVCTRERLLVIEQHFNCHYLYKFTEVFQFIPFLEGRAYSETRDLPGVVPTVDVSTKSPMASSEGRVLQMICSGPTSRLDLEYSSKPCSRANLLSSFCTLFLWKMHGHARTLGHDQSVSFGYDWHM